METAQQTTRYLDPASVERIADALTRIAILHKLEELSEDESMKPKDGIYSQMQNQAYNRIQSHLTK